MGENSSRADSKLTLSNKKKNLPDYLLYGIGKTPERKPKSRDKVNKL